MKYVSRVDALKPAKLYCRLGAANVNALYNSGRQTSTSYTTEAFRLGSHKVLLRSKDAPLERREIAHVVFIFERLADGYIDDGRPGAIAFRPFRAELRATLVQASLQTRRPD